MGNNINSNNFNNIIIMKRKFIWIVISTIIMIGILTLSSCVTTKNTTHNCELMKNGQKCLADHSCCK